MFNIWCIFYGSMKYPRILGPCTKHHCKYLFFKRCFIYFECRGKKSKLILANGFSFYTPTIWYRFSQCSYSSFYSFTIFIYICDFSITFIATHSEFKCNVNWHFYSIEFDIIFTKIISVLNIMSCLFQVNAFTIIKIINKHSSLKTSSLRTIVLIDLLASSVVPLIISDYLYMQKSFYAFK